MKTFIVKKGSTYVEPIKFLKSKNIKVFFLEGDLGAGKTTFTIEFLKSVSDEKSFSALGVMSPTYSIVNEYFLEGQLILHSDFYRVDEKSFEWEEFLERSEESSLSFIEWGEKIPQIRQNIPSYTTVKIQILKNGDREISLF